MGSKKLRVKGRTRLIMTTSLPVICSDMISGSHVSLSLPVILRRRRVRRNRMLLAEVSGSKKKRKTRQKADSHINSLVMRASGLAQVDEEELRQSVMARNSTHQIGHVHGAVKPP
jgi:hypothetical protein